MTINDSIVAISMCTLLDGSIIRSSDDINVHDDSDDHHVLLIKIQHTDDVKREDVYIYNDNSDIYLRAL